MSNTSYDRAFKATNRALHADWNFFAAWREVLRAAAGTRPKAHMKQVMRIDPTRDLDAVTSAMHACFVNEPPASSIRGYWLGLYEGENGYALSFVGAKSYSTKDNQWAVDPSWTPSGGDFQPPMLAAISKLRPDDYDVALELEMCAIFPFSVLACREALRRLDPALTLRRAPSRGACCGFNDGDWLHLGKITPRGLLAPKLA
jgi:hypothetical protein